MISIRALNGCFSEWPYRIVPNFSSNHVQVGQQALEPHHCLGKHDVFIYYILFTFEQLQLNPEIVPLHLLGICNKEDEFFKIAYKYIKNCDVFDVTQYEATLDQNEAAIRKHFILFHSWELFLANTKGAV